MPDTVRDRLHLLKPFTYPWDASLVVSKAADAVFRRSGSVSHEEVEHLARRWMSVLVDESDRARPDVLTQILGSLFQVRVRPGTDVHVRVEWRDAGNATDDQILRGHRFDIVQASSVNPARLPVVQLACFS